MYLRGRALSSLAIPTSAERPQADAGTSAADDALDRDDRRNDGEDLRKIFAHVFTSFLNHQENEALMGVTICCLQTETGSGIEFRC